MVTVGDVLVARQKRVVAWSAGIDAWLRFLMGRAERLVPLHSRLPFAAGSTVSSAAPAQPVLSVSRSGVKRK